MLNIKNIRNIFNINPEYYKYYHYSKNIDNFILPLQKLLDILDRNTLKMFSNELLCELKKYSYENKQDFDLEIQIFENIANTYINDKTLVEELKIFCERFRDFLQLNTTTNIEFSIFGKYKYRAPMSDVFLKSLISFGQIIRASSTSSSKIMKDVFFNYLTSTLNQTEKMIFKFIVASEKEIEKNLQEFDNEALVIFKNQDIKFEKSVNTTKKGGFEVEFHADRLNGNIAANPTKDKKIESDTLELLSYESEMEKILLFKNIKNGEYTDTGSGKLILNPAVLDVTNSSVSMEYSTPPRNYQELEKFANEIVNFLKEKGGFTSTDAGLHVHVSIADYGLPIKDNKIDIKQKLTNDSKKRLINLITHYSKYEEEIMNHCPEQRQADNNFLTATLLSHQGYHKEDINKDESKKKAFCLLYNKLKNCENIEEMLQVMGLGARVLTIAIRPEFQTIEFRGLPGILDKDYISNYVEFCFDIVESCKNEKQYDLTTHSNYDSIIKKLRELGSDGVSQVLNVRPAIFSRISPFYSSSYNIDFLSKQKQIQEDPTSKEFRSYIKEVNKSKTKLAIPTEKQSNFYFLNCGKTTVENIIEQESFDLLLKKQPKVCVADMTIPQEAMNIIIQKQELTKEELFSKYKISKNKAMVNELD